MDLQMELQMFMFMKPTLTVGQESGHSQMPF